jgi:hypothetical protein
MTETADWLVQVLRHPDEALTPETIDGAHHSGLFVSAGATEHFRIEFQRNLGYPGSCSRRLQLTV